MLSSLYIKNYVLIDELHVRFSDGLTIITGETGAGKSILLGALSLVLGKRADLSQIKNGSEKCIVEAIFNIEKYQLQTLFKSEDLDYEPNTIIRREILPSGKSRAFVNDTPVNLDSLQTLSAFLLDIHSQHETRDLLYEDYQFFVIDALASCLDDIEAYKERLKAYRVCEKTLQSINDLKSTSLKEYDYNAFLLKELETEKLETIDFSDLEERYEQLSNVETINEKLQLCLQIISNEEFGVLDRLTEAKRELQQISSFGKAYQQLEERLESLKIELNDILNELESLDGQVESDPKELTAISEKLHRINSLMHKHSVMELSDLVNIQKELHEKVSTSENLDEDIIKTSHQLDRLNTEILQVSQAIRSKRSKAIPKLVSELETILKSLGMPNAKVNIEIEPSESFKANGMDKLRFLFTANKGGQFQELKSAVSGGELSRIMLAIKSILANYMHLPTLLFDEIDTGVSGEISNKMGDIMKAMSTNMQLLSITHLPQVAAKGHAHFKVYKLDTETETQTHIKKLEGDERIIEIAQMLGGEQATESAIAHAKQLLN